MPQISAVVFAAIALLAIMIAIDATPIDRLTARHGNLVYHQPVIRESVGSEPGHPRTKEEQTTEMINAATGVTVALTGALASTGALPELKDAAHKGVQTVHTAIHHVQDKVHNATTEMKVGEEKVKEHLPFHHHPKDYDEHVAYTITPSTYQDADRPATTTMIYTRSRQVGYVFDSTTP
ncbi:hypothetical protein EV359DRAFT_83328 [Lentinula novae-zelandiae]|nr:hypothetical protein EV359DRAFT_83328 [Lentinula novae-zelandiae]